MKILTASTIIAVLPLSFAGRSKYKGLDVLKML